MTPFSKNLLIGAIVLVGFCVLLIVFVCVYFHRWFKAKLGRSKSNKVIPASVQPHPYQPILEEYEIEMLKTPAELVYSAKYDHLHQQLTVKVLEAQHLPISSKKQKSLNPLVKIYLSSEHRRRAVTKVKRNTNNPIFNEEFTLKVSMEEMQERKVFFRVYDHQSFGSQTLIGYVEVPLKTIIHRGGETVTARICPIINQRGEEKYPQLFLSFQSLPKANKLEVTLLEGMNFPPPLDGEISAFSIQLKLKSSSRKKTRYQKHMSTIKRNTCNPYFHEKFSFDILAKDLPNAELQIVLFWHRGRFHKEPIGKVCLHSKSSPVERKHWIEILTGPNKLLSQWHCLRPMYD